MLASSYTKCIHFRFSPGWFDRFKARNDLSYRRATNVVQQKPSDHEIKIRSFHQEIRRVAASEAAETRQLGKFSLATIANVDQTPLPFTFNKGQGYDQKGAKTVWRCGAQPGLDKRQFTVQLTIFADGEPRIKPLLIFRGKGLRISQAERKEHDRRVVVKFQEMPGAMTASWSTGSQTCGDDLLPTKHKSQSF